MSEGKRAFRTVIITFSPHGNTRRVADRIFEIFHDERLDVSLIDLTGRRIEEFEKFDFSKIPPFDFLVVVSPLYAWKIILPLEILLSNMPDGRGKYAALAVTYGGVTSGHALYNAAKLLGEKGISTLGAVKVVASHSNVLDEKKDPFIKHPDGTDLEMVEAFAHGMIEKMGSECRESISPDTFRPQFLLVRLLSKTYFSKRHSRKFPPGIRFIHKKCTQCGRCVKACPIDIIKLDPYPTKDGTCIKCHNCKRVCPKGAVKSTGLWRKFVFHYCLLKLHSLPFIKGEKPMTQVFLENRRQ
jgi:ferredoxin